jgi:hypothetical protein
MPHQQGTKGPTVFGYGKTEARLDCRTGGSLGTRAWLSMLCSGVLVAVSVSGCASRSGANPLLDRLDGRGPVVLSQNNPFLPADRVFDNALANSSVIKEFVEQQGKPAALSVEKGLLSPTTLTFYYPGKEEFYTLKPMGDDWEVSGPDIMFPDEAQEMLSELGAVVPVPAKPQISDRRTATFGRSNGSLSNLDAISARARMDPEKIAPKVSEKTEKGTKLKEKGSREPIPQKATVKKLASGSLQHTVTFPTETLASIAKWYTGSAKNAGAIAKLNKISPHHHVTVGEKVVIPKQMLKTSAPMTRAAA